jgi:hypothetical protein
MKEKGGETKDKEEIEGKGGNIGKKYAGRIEFGILWNAETKSSSEGGGDLWFSG